ncbi:MAG: glycosyltransferase, partial [Patescibacteria group bacterium]|nr:glycosyltransferase [Patescibacteria group bacterium]
MMTEQPIRILHIVGIMDQGGIETLLMNLYRNIDRSVIQFDFLTHSTQKGFFDDEIMSLGGKIYSVVNPFSITGALKYQKALSDFFTEHPEYTIVHSHMNTFSGIILNIAKKSGVKKRIAHSHATDIENPIKRQIGHISKILGQNSITHFFACSKAAAKWSFGKQVAKTMIFKNAIDLSQYRFSNKIRSEYRKQLNLEDKYVIGHVGRFTEIKNHSFLIDIFSKLHATRNNTTLLLIGDGPLLKDIKHKVKELGL